MEIEERKKEKKYVNKHEDYDDVVLERDSYKR